MRCALALLSLVAWAETVLLQHATVIEGDATSTPLAEQQLEQQLRHGVTSVRDIHWVIEGGKIYDWED